MSARRRSEPLPEDDLMLAAVDRAQRHGDCWLGRYTRVSDVAAHLAMPWHGATSRRLTRIMIRLADGAGWVERSYRRGVAVWRLTDAGRKRLAQALERGVALPQSPQHRRWCQARDNATQHLPGLRSQARDLLTELTALLDADASVPAERWFEMSRRLREVLRCVGLGTYVLHEKSEPDDSQADKDERPPGGMGWQYVASPNWPAFELDELSGWS